MARHLPPTACRKSARPGEPLLRKHIEVLIAQLATLRTPEGQPLELTLTTNGSLPQKARALKDAGLHRVTVSLDGLDDATFRRTNDVDFPVADVLTDWLPPAKWAWCAVNGGPSGLKINMVVKRGTNDDQILPMARHFRGSGITLRFIEYMDVGATNGWRMDEVRDAQRRGWWSASAPSCRWCSWSHRPLAKPPNAGAMLVPTASTTPRWVRSA